MNALRPPYTAALAAHGVLAAYFQAIMWLPLGAWNHQPCCRVIVDDLSRGHVPVDDLILSAALALPIVVFAAGAVLRERIAGLALMGTATLALAAWLSLQLITHWPPYIFGADERWTRIWMRAFSESTQILPRWDNHLPPDASHLTLQVLIVLALVLSVRALLAASRLRRGAR